MTIRDQPQAIFLDTEVFHRLHFDYSSTNFRLLQTRVSSGMIRIFLTDVTKREIESHIREKAAEAYQQLEKLRRSPGIRSLRRPPFNALWSGVEVNENTICEEMVDQFAYFCRQMKIQVLPAGSIDASALLDDYFNHRPPFGTGKKKSEFPDAIAASAIRKWCEKSRTSMWVVSGDTDWRALCESHSLLEYKEKLGDVLTEFTDHKVLGKFVSAIQQHKDEIADLIWECFQRLDFAGAVERVHPCSIETGEPLVIDIEGNCAVAEMNCTIHYEADVLYDDQPATRREVAKVVATISVAFKKSRPGEIAIRDVKLNVDSID